MAVASGGGHWVQLLRLRPAFEGHDVTYVTVQEGYRTDIGNSKFRVVPNANRDTKIKLIRSALASAFLLLRERPDVVITTGAAVGFFTVRLASLMGIKTVWVDSVANAEELSLSGRKAGRFVDLWLTQWSHLADDNGPQFLGSVL